LFIVEEDNVLDNYEDDVGCFGDDYQNHWNHFWCLVFFIAWNVKSMDLRLFWTLGFKVENT
jgi:hypothetical protein